MLLDRMKLIKERRMVIFVLKLLCVNAKQHADTLNFVSSIRIYYFKSNNKIINTLELILQQKIT